VAATVRCFDSRSFLRQRPGNRERRPYASDGRASPDLRWRTSTRRELIAMDELSKAALALLRLHISGGSLMMGACNPDTLPDHTVEETRATYGELVAAGLMDRLHTFAHGRDSRYRLTRGDPSGRPSTRAEGARRSGQTNPLRWLHLSRSARVAVYTKRPILVHGRSDLCFARLSALRAPNRRPNPK
jgi:hypothetical protein